MYIPRMAETAVAKALKTFPMVVLTGPRQAGKTTLLREKFGEGRRAVSLDALDARDLAERDPRAFLDRIGTPALIDEIQNVPSLLSYVKERVDEKREPGAYILTGSRHFPLMKGVSESLAGRAAVLRLFSLSLREISGGPLGVPTDAVAAFRKASGETAGPSRRDLGGILLRGGYPELHAGRRPDTNLFFSSYVQTYIERDVRGAIRSGNLHDFDSLLKLLAARTAQILDLSSISRDLGVSVPTVKSWLSLLEEASLVFLLPPFTRNPGKRVVKSPKMYFLDTGLCAWLTGLQTPAHALSGPMGGPLFETLVVTEIFKRFRTLSLPANLAYWRTSDGHEVDLVIEADGRLHPVEIKMSSTLREGHWKGIETWRKVTGGSDAEAFLVSSSPITGEVSKGIWNVHWSRL